MLASVCVIVGAGGAAAGAFVALILAKAQAITVVNRNLERAEELVDRMASRACGIELSATTIHGRRGGRA